MCYGIQYANNKEGMKAIVFTNRRHGVSISDTVEDIMAMYPLKKKDAEKVVKENWDIAEMASERK